MTRMRTLAVAAAVAVAVAAAGGGAAPALAATGGQPQEESCGIGREGAHAAIADQTSPGATEFARFPPSEAGCTGSGA